VTRTLRLVAVLLLGVPGVALAATSIAAIVGAGESYSGQQVVVTGSVASPVIGYAGEVVYTLTDQDARISVFGYGTPPAVGDRVEVTAKVGWREGDDEFTWPPILLESARHAVP
jgi:hypothetical protein